MPAEKPAPFEIAWQAPEFDYRHKGVSWYWATIAIAVVFMGLSVWQKNFLFGFFILVAEILILVWANKEPAMIDFRLTDHGVSIGAQKFYDHSGFESWSAEAEGDAEWTSALVSFRSKFKPALHLKLPKARAEEIKQKLGLLLPQVEHKPSFLDTLEEFLRF